MDALARIEPVARRMVRQVDDALATLGAPAQHPVWDLLRQVQATPADAVAFAVALDPAALDASVAGLRNRTTSHEAISIPVAVDWIGSAGRRYQHRARAYQEYVTGAGEDSLVGRLAATAGYLDDLVQWSVQARHGMATALARAMTSAEALVLVGGRAAAQPWSPNVIAAAATIGAHILAAAVHSMRSGQAVLDRWRPVLGELPAVAVSVDAGPSDSAMQLRQ
ncbi:MAG TPA: hypothetical protein VF163_00880 [Micromonosporaceae bacterium]